MMRFRRVRRLYSSTALACIGRCGFLCATILLLFGYSSLDAQIAMQNVPGRNKVSLNGEWQIIINWFDIKRNPIGMDQKPRQDKEFVEFDFSDELKLRVPGDWNSQLRELKYYEGTVCYKRTFDHYQKPSRRTFLYFGAANYETQVYLN